MKKNIIKVGEGNTPTRPLFYLYNTCALNTLNLPRKHSDVPFFLLKIHPRSRPRDQVVKARET